MTIRAFTGNGIEYCQVDIADGEALPAWLDGMTEIAVQTPVVDTRAILVVSAQAALTDSDITILRCYENAVAVPAEWATYRTALRAIISGTDTTSSALPTKPVYPVGT